MSKDPLMTLVSTNLDDPSLQGLGMYVSLRGVSDAGHAHDLVCNELFGNLNSELYASFDADELVVYSAQRPRVSFLGDHFAGYQEPRIEIYLMTDALDRKFWFLTGVEPDLRWERTIAELLNFIDAFNVQLVTGTVSLPMPVPHTRPVGVTAHGNRKDLTENISTWAPTAETPSGLMALLEIRLNDAGRDVVGYSLHTPHYLAESEYPAVAVAALEHVGAALKLALPTEKLREAARLIESQLAEQIEGSNEVKQMVLGFEKRFDEHAQDHERRSLLLDEDEKMPNAEELGASVEDFLATIEDSADWLNANGKSGGADSASGDPDQ
ncbi:PAC2 family protein [Arthrobacter sp. MYb224]|nr:PAC2 family protein [Arthrobacter sp. MYb224]PRA06358.1 PAC2 family protein [Arthrobacter sp. MYb229]PRB53260.1 PAC2 family protein [Arthrobacter sp. MYb216]